MQISLENTGALERKLTVTLPASRLEDEIRSRLQQLSREVRLNGFRPGKVPMSVISKRFGSQVRDEVFEELVRDSFGEALRKENLRPAMSPKITPVKDAGADQLAFTAEFEVLPELDTIDVSGLSIARIEAEVADRDIDNMIETLRQQRKSWSSVERPAAEGDLVLFEHSASNADGRFPAEGSERAGTVIGSSALPAGFEAELVGMSAEQEKTFDTVFPETWPEAALAGKEASVTVKVTQVKSGVLPEVNKEFIESFGIADGDVGQFRSDIRANLERELDNAVGARLKEEVIKQLLAAHPDLQVPASLVEQEIQALHREQQRRAQQSGGDAAAVPAAESFRDQAADSIRAMILISELARQNDIRMDDNRLRQRLLAIAATYEQPEELIRMYTSNESMMQRLQQSVLEQQVVEWVADKAPGPVSKLSFDEVLKPGAQAGAAADA